MNMKISIRELANGDGRVLAGAITGRRIFTKLLECTDKEPPTPKPLFLDFAGVDVATASFLRETILAFRNTVRLKHSKFYPIIANANEVVADELAVLLDLRGDVLMLCSLDEKDQPHEPRLLGDLDPKQRITFELVQEREETNAAELYKQCDDKIEPTAWNNRLAALAGLGIIVELSQGRSKRYRPLLRRVKHGH
jgi:hypothetical protein